MIYEKYEGDGGSVTLPQTLNDQTVTAIGAKAFLSRKDIFSLTLPTGVSHIGDWAFAHMHQLTELTLPANRITFGKQVFLDCDKLQCIRVLPDTSRNPGLPFFLASAATILGHSLLMDPFYAAAAQTHPTWMHAYDTILAAYLEADDLEGYEPVFYGWFNDEDADITQKPKHLARRRRHKVHLVFQRLLYDQHLSPSLRETLEAFLRDHMPWGALAHVHTAVWNLLPKEYGTEFFVYPILAQANAIPSEHIPELIEHMKDAEPEILAWLLRYREQHCCSLNFFDEISL